MNEANKRKTGNKRHQHIPVVYYEGKKAWTADRHFRGRIAKDNLFQDWIPDFCYEVVRIHDYSNEELLERGNEMSLIMLFNKIQDVVDLAEFLKLPQDKLDRKVKDTPETVLDVIVSVMESLCMKVGAAEDCESREMGSGSGTEGRGGGTEGSGGGRKSKSAMVNIKLQKG